MPLNTKDFWIKIYHNSMVENIFNKTMPRLTQPGPRWRILGARWYHSFRIGHHNPRIWTLLSTFLKKWNQITKREQELKIRRNFGNGFRGIFIIWKSMTFKNFTIVWLEELWRLLRHVGKERNIDLNFLTLFINIYWLFYYFYLFHLFFTTLLLYYDR